jgi:hypothetical protein
MFTTYLKAPEDGLPRALRPLVVRLKRDVRLTQELSKANKDIDTALLKTIIIELLASPDAKVDFAGILREMSAQAIAHPQNRPSQKQVAGALDKMLTMTFILQPHLRRGVERLATRPPLEPEDVLLVSEVFSEIKPEAEAGLREVIDEVSGLKRIKKIVKEKLRSENGEAFVELEFLPAKTELDYFFGYFGENCTSGHPEELLNPAFTPIRIIADDKIAGCIHTLTLDIGGKKSLVICGMEPQKPLADRLNADDFVKGVLEKLTAIAAQNGYGQVLISTTNATLSNRDNISEAMRRLIRDRDRVTQSVQKNFPEKTEYSIRELAVWRTIGKNDAQGSMADGGMAPGGIDFRELPASVRPMIDAALTELNSVALPEAVDLGREWKNIERMAGARMTPSCSRINEFMAACYRKGELSNYAGGVRACIADILSREEEETARTETAVRNLLALLDNLS